MRARHPFDLRTACITFALREHHSLHSAACGRIADAPPLVGHSGRGVGVGLSVLDSAIANVALPTIAKDLDTSPAASIWIVNAYQLAIMVSLLSFSALGELVGVLHLHGQLPLHLPVLRREAD